MSYMDSAKIVVVGSSYSSAAVFYYLEKYLTKTRQPVDLLLISEKNNFFFYDLLPMLLSDSCDLSDISQDFRSLVFIRPGVSHLKSSILNIDFNQNVIKTSKGGFNYDYLVLAPENDLCSLNQNIEDYNNIEIFKFSSPIDILKFKNHILKNIQVATSENNLETKKSLLTFSILGGKSFGVELACSISDSVRDLLKKRFPEINPSFLKINLVEEGNTIIESEDPFYKTNLFYNLNKKAITLHLNSKVTNISKEKIEINGESEIPAGTIIYGTRNKNSSLIEKLPLKKDGSGYACVDLYMKADGLDNVFVIGNSSKCLDMTDDRPETVVLHNEQAKICATNIFAKINNNLLKALKPVINMQFLSLGRKDSLVIINNLHLNGFLPWVFHREVFALFLLGWKKKLRAFLGIFLDIFCLREYFFIDISELNEIKDKIKR